MYSGLSASEQAGASILLFSPAKQMLPLAQKHPGDL